eukprot:1934879-Prymnesium_polylepis.1
MPAALCAREHAVARDSEDGVRNDAKSLPWLPKAPACEHGLWEDCRYALRWRPAARVPSHRNRA